MALLRPRGAAPIIGGMAFDQKYKSTHFMFLRKNTILPTGNFVPVRTFFLGTDWLPSRTSGAVQAARAGQGRVYSRRRKQGLRNYLPKPAKPMRAP